MAIISFTSCKTDCEWLANVYRNEECVIIVDKLSLETTSTLTITGTSLEDNKSIESTPN